jgi:hypothetical protein
VSSRIFQFDPNQLKMAFPSKMGQITQEIIGMKIRIFFRTHIDIAGGKPEGKRLLCRHMRR